MKFDGGLLGIEQSCLLFFAEQQFPIFQGGFLFAVVTPLDTMISLGLSVTSGPTLGMQVRVEGKEEEEEEDEVTESLIGKNLPVFVYTFDSVKVGQCFNYQVGLVYF